MNIATTLRYVDLKKDDPWKFGYYTQIDYFKMAEKYGIGITAIVSEYDFEKICENCDGLIIAGSSTNIDPAYYGKPSFETPEPADEFALDSKLIEYFVKNNKPVFGICGGHQAINICMGGSLKKVDEPDKHQNFEKASHSIEIAENSFVYDVFGKKEATVNCYHSWEIDRLAPGFEVVARTADGVIEAIENKEKRIFATQWHPELSFCGGDTTEHKFFENFFKLCEK